MREVLRLAVAPVDNYGTITSSNALEIYTAWRKGEVTLSSSQQAYTKHFLTQAQMDDVDYDTGNSSAKAAGQSAIDSEDAENDENQTGNAIGTSVGSIASVAAVIGILNFADKFDGFTGLLAAIGTGVVAGVSVVTSNAFDSSYSGRVDAKDNADETNATIDGYNEALAGTMDSMNEDMENYQSASDEYTLSVNETGANIADLQIQLADAQAAGDTSQVKSLNEKISQAQKTDFSGQEEGLAEISDRLDEYRDNNEESTGVAESGRAVSDFLKVGWSLSPVAALDFIILTLAGTLCSLAIMKASPKLPLGMDVPSTIASKVAYGLAGMMFLAAAKIMNSKTTNEFECGQAGDGMGSTTAALEGMISEQSEYIGATGDTYTDIDETSEETQAEAQQKADQSVADNTKGSGPTKNKKTSTDKNDEKEEDTATV